MGRLRGLGILAVFAALQLGWADSFGRFGYRPLADLPGFQVDASGIQARDKGADQLLFPQKSKLFRPTITNTTSQAVDLDCGPAGPSAVRFSLIGDSLDLYWNSSIELDLHCQVPPFLSWKDGSVGPNVPTPVCPWLVLSFASDQPPIVLGFSGAACSLKVEGKPGDFKIVGGPFKGWLRMMLPLGLLHAHATDAASLGALVAPIAKEAIRWSAPTPKVLNQVVTADDLGVDAQWTFTGQGAIVPPAVLLAQLGGYPVSIRTPHHPLAGAYETGPLEAVDGDSLTVHFPSRLVRPGRALGLAPIGDPPKKAADPLRASDIPSIVDLAFACLIADRGPDLGKAADDASTAYLSNTPYFTEPFTKQQLPFNEEGSGLDLASAYALLGQATSSAVASQEPNALFTSVICRRDWWTWRLWGADRAVARRATALAAIAGTLSQDPVNRLLGAMLEAGLDAERGQSVIDRRLGRITGQPSFSEPMLDLRAQLFALQRTDKVDSSFFDLLESPLRIGEGEGVTLVDEFGGLDLKWQCLEPKPSVITFIAAPDLQVAPRGNVLRLNLERSDTALSMFYLPDAYGPCQARLSFSSSPPHIPMQVQPPKYEETPRA